MELTDDDVLEILKLFEQSKFDFLQLEQGERKITVSKGGYIPQSTGAAPAPVRAVAAPPPSAAAPTGTLTRNPSPPSAPQPAPGPPATSADAGLVPVTAPMIGKFYAAPSPADPPYVEVGSKVAA